MAQVKLRKDFYGTKIAKVSSDYLYVTIEFDYSGPAQTLEIEVTSGKRGAWGDYDQESPAYYHSKSVYESDYLRHYSFSCGLPLSFWGTRQIDDCAVEVVIRGEGVYDDAVFWDAYTVNLAPAGISFQIGIWGVPDFGSYQKWWAYYWDPGINDFVDCGKWYYSYQKISFSNVQSGGYLAVFLMRNSTVSSQYTSPTFEAVDGGSYTYDVQTGRIY